MTPMSVFRRAAASIRALATTAPLVRHIGRPRTPWTKSDVVAVVSVVVAATAIVVPTVLSRQSNEVASSALDQARRANDIAASAQVLRPGLQISAKAAYITDGISGTSTGGVSESGADPESPAPQNDLPGPKIDITLSNSSTGASLVAAAVVDVSVAQHLERCFAIGGSVVVSADYDVRIPNPPPPAPFMVTRDMRFEVESGRHDRFTLTIGPTPVGEGEAPMLVVAAVTLVHDGGSRLAAGTFALVDSGYGAFYALPDGTWEVPAVDSVTQTEKECLRRNEAAVQQVVRRPEITVSRELATLEKALRVF
ncbi:hypothetical protein ACQP2Y_23950 [Actinoplanes sp. CA-051413]|uniref:hypothetical protein n=1 Tax=Actinoplanes sp. CA-051413 TaxID=3239899 RepID=UPI003D994F06